MNCNMFPTMTKEEGDKLETVYVPGAGPDFVVYIQSFKTKAQLTSIDGRARWVITKKDGTQYIARPASIKLEIDHE